MPKYIIRDTTPCYVSWYYEVEALDEDAAYEQFCDGSYSGAQAIEIGDSIDWVDGQETTVVANMPATARLEDQS